MSQNRKALKIVSLVQVLIAVWAFVVGCIAIQGSGYAEESGGFFGVLLANVDGILLVATGVLSIICAWMGIHGANRPSRLGSHRLMALLALVCALTSAFVTSTTGVPVCGVVAGITAIAAAVLDTLCRRELDRM